MQSFGNAWTAWINHHKEPPLLLPLSHACDSEHRRRRRTHSLGDSECSGQVLGDLDEPSQASLSKSVSGDCPVPVPSFI